MNTTSGLEARIRRLEDIAAIHDLVGRYGIAMDDRDLAAFPDLFVDDVLLKSADGVMNARGLSTVTELFRGRFVVLGPSNHFTHDKVITFDDADPDSARGLVLAHAEMNRNGQAMIAAIRYHDRYRRVGGRWKIAERTLTFFYYVAASEYVDALGAGLKLRQRAYAEPMPPDWPENLPTWKAYYGT